ncbi:MAG: DegT/DnrJ/EryC1/StrS family aminotransferase [Promethearchaeota archaeon]
MAFEQEAKKNFPNWPIYDEAEIEALAEVIKSGNWWCGSPSVHKGENVWNFQEAFAKYQEAKNCVAVFNGTVAIECALLALGIGLGDEVIVSDYTFVASASAVVATNAIPIFVDIDPETLVMDVDKVEQLITKKTKAIVPVHLGGNCVEMDRLMEIAEKYDLKVVEDSSHAQGSRYKGKRAGNWGHAGTFSFQASKVLTAGEGGAIITNDDDLADLIYSISDCGRNKNEYFYKHFRYGSNFRMSEYQAAVLNVQLKKFPKQHELRNKNARYLSQKLNDIDGIRAMKPTPGMTELGWYIYPFVFEPEKFGNITKEQFYKTLNDNGIPTDDCYPPLHGLDCFKNVDLRKGIDYSSANWGGSKSDNVNFPVVSDIYSRSVEFPHEMLLASKEKLDWVAKFIESMKK